MIDPNCEKMFDNGNFGRRRKTKKELELLALASKSSNDSPCTLSSIKTGNNPQCTQSTLSSGSESQYTQSNSVCHKSFYSNAEAETQLT